MSIVTATAFFLVIVTGNLDLTDGKRYAVYNPNCHMLDPDPFDLSILRFVKKANYTSCAQKPPLTSVSQVSRSHVLHLHRKNFHHYSPDGSPIRCMLEGVLPLYHDQTFIEDVEFVRVRCFLDRYDQKQIYTNLHAFIGFKEKVGRKISQNLENPSEFRKMGVMFVGFDSMSRSSIRRNMPKTVQLLERTGWYVLKGYNKIEDNTFPNLMAILSGNNVQQLKQTCWYDQYVHFDSCPFIWKEFSKKGYITAYAEDKSLMGTFNCVKAGFYDSPTDYYLRPFMKAAETFIDVDNGKCLGLAKPAHHIFNYSIDFAECFFNQPTFSLFWINSFSHNDANEPSTMDEDVVDYFKRLEKSGILKTTMVIFLSDHGLRVGPIRETYVGRIEDRLPFIYIWLPEWYKAANPEKAKNLANNSNKLTSPYDIHMTLVDILGDKTTAEGCPSCQSLFKPVPWNRSCSEAGITEHWCACNEYEELQVAYVSPWMSQLAQTVVDRINDIVHSHSGCSQLELSKILSVRHRTFGASTDKSYTVAILTSPGDGKFEATAIKTVDWTRGTKKWKILDTISRINIYGFKNFCTNDYLVREYCICTPELNKE
ncbi:hypothetical protein GE061_015520 [Apolygus lucorum]|uniref:DUF229 domain-containing protein n=1 Tax=Apolygus lucorum TaxID=248454 RepID=A0A8S9XL81_APOLU|nr:hypothetical protein GE061_015520 [Apolygus lucorum]